MTTVRPAESVREIALKLAQEKQKQSSLEDDSSDRTIFVLGSSSAVKPRSVTPIIAASHPIPFSVGQVNDNQSISGPGRCPKANLGLGL